MGGVLTGSGRAPPGGAAAGPGGRAAGPGWRRLAERHRAPGTWPRTASDAHSLPGLARGSIRSLPAAGSAGGPGSGFQTRKFQGHLTTPGLLELGFLRVPAATWGDGGGGGGGGGTEDARAPSSTPVPRGSLPPPGLVPSEQSRPALPQTERSQDSGPTAELGLLEVRFLATSQILSSFQKEQLGKPQRLSVLVRSPGVPREKGPRALAGCFSQGLFSA